MWFLINFDFWVDFDGEGKSLYHRFPCIPTSSSKHLHLDHHLQSSHQIWLFIILLTIDTEVFTPLAETIMFKSQVTMFDICLVMYATFMNANSAAQDGNRRAVSFVKT